MTFTDCLKRYAVAVAGTYAVVACGIAIGVLVLTAGVGARPTGSVARSTVGSGVVAAAIALGPAIGAVAGERAASGPSRVGADAAVYTAVATGGFLGHAALQVVVWTALYASLTTGSGAIFDGALTPLVASGLGSAAAAAGGAWIRLQVGERATYANTRTASH